MKNKICLVSDWYPTEENPYKGNFFKEQALCLCDETDVVVFRFREYIKKSIFENDIVRLVGKEKNTVVYEAVAYIPLFAYIMDFVRTCLVKMNGNTIEGVGKYISTYRRNTIDKKITKLFKKTDQNVDIFYCVDAQKEAFYTECLAQYFNKPFVVGEHGPVPWPGTVLFDINKYAIENAEMFLAISVEKIRQLMLLNISLPKIVYIGNMVDDSIFVKKQKNNERIKTFLIVASHSFYKNYDMFIDVINRLNSKTKIEFNVLIVGYAANKGYSKNILQFENKIKETSFFDKTTLIPEVTHDEMCEIYNRADAFVMTSIQEGQPVAALEAACCGLPIFSTRCGGVEDYIDEKMGRIYSVVDVEGMADGLNDYLLGNISFDSDYIRERVISEFGRREFGRKFNKIIMDVIG